MSSRRGNVNKSGPPKHHNKSVFKNNMHDTSDKTKTLNAMEIYGLCPRCKEQIQWKIKYKKYKPLTVPKKCTKCGEKRVRHAYHTVCTDCSRRDRVCSKCATKYDDLSGKPGGQSSGETGGQSSGETGGQSSGEPGGQSSGEPGDQSHQDQVQPTASGIKWSVADKDLKTDIASQNSRHIDPDSDSDGQPDEVVLPS